MLRRGQIERAAGPGAGPPALLHARPPARLRPPPCRQQPSSHLKSSCSLLDSLCCILVYLYPHPGTYLNKGL